MTVREALLGYAPTIATPSDTLNSFNALPATFVNITRQSQTSINPPPLIRPDQPHSLYAPIVPNTHPRKHPSPVGCASGIEMAVRMAVYGGGRIDLSVEPPVRIELTTFSLRVRRLD